METLPGGWEESTALTLDAICPVQLRDSADVLLEPPGLDQLREQRGAGPQQPSSGSSRTLETWKRMSSLRHAADGQRTERI